MNDLNEKSLNELFEKFFDDEQAKSFAEDIQKAEQILRGHPAPEPDDMLIANIKAEIAMRLPAERARHFRRMVYKLISIAAAIVILATISVQFLVEDGKKPREVSYASLIPAAIWDSDDITADDENLAIFTAEIEEIEGEVLNLESGEDTGNGNRTITELEMELIEINSDFWKG